MKIKKERIIKREYYEHTIEGRKVNGFWRRLLTNNLVKARPKGLQATQTVCCVMAKLVSHSVSDTSLRLTSNFLSWQQ